MAKLLAIGASTSSKSINRAFAAYAASLIEAGDVVAIDLNEFEMPIYSADREENGGIPEAAKAFVSTVGASDAIILSLAEHNGSYTAAFKNIMDWASRHERKLWAGKPMLLLSTSPGPRGAASVLAAASATFPHLGAEVAASFSLPSFGDNFSAEAGISDPNLKRVFGEALAQFSAAITT